MEILFSCPNCRQQLEADSGMSGSNINCPTCQATLSIPEADPTNLRAGPPPARVDKHFAVPQRQTTDVLIQKPNRPLEMVAKDGTKQIRMKCIKRGECVEVGKDHFDEVVSEFLAKIGEGNIISMLPINYSHIDLGSKQMLNDFGIMIIFRG